MFSTISYDYFKSPDAKIIALDTNVLPSQDLIVLGQHETIQEGDSETEVEHPMMTQEDLTHMLGLGFLND